MKIHQAVYLRDTSISVYVFQENTYKKNHSGFSQEVILEQQEKRWGGQLGNLCRHLGVRSEGALGGAGSSGETPAFRRAGPPFLTSRLLASGKRTPLLH